MQLRENVDWMRNVIHSFSDTLILYPQALSPVLDMINYVLSVTSLVNYISLNRVR